MNVALVQPTRPTLRHLPPVLLAVPMGIGGVGLAWRQAAATLGAPGLVGEVLLALTTLLWVGLVGLHAARGLRHPEMLAADWAHPVRVPFAAAPTIGLMIVSAFLYPYAPSLGAGLWGVASAVHLTVAMLLLRRIVAGAAEPAMVTPPLMVPLVGNILAPLFGARMGFVDASWMMFGVGLLLWLAIFPLLLHRLIAGPALPPALRPTLFILIAPPAVASLALAAITGDPGGVSLAFAGLAVLVVAVLVSLAAEFARLPFGLPWWGTTFPTAAFAAMLMVEGFPAWLCWPALLATTGLTAWIAWRTALAARAGAFFRPEG